MTKERREEAVLVALVVSLALHVALMFLIRPKTLTETFRGRTVERRVQVSVTREAPHSDPSKIAELMDLEPLKDAPAVAAYDGVPSALKLEEVEWTAPSPTVADAHLAPELAPAVFDVKPSGLLERGPALAPTIGLPLTAPQSAEPVFSSPLPQPMAVGARAPVLPKCENGGGLLPTAVGRKPAEDRAPFKPAEEVYSAVEEKIVEAEKQAVKMLMDVDDARDLEKFVNVTMTSQSVEGWRYFRVMMTPRVGLPVVPKDVVILIDGSGSIGNDRLASCRNAARRILRTCTNTGDRFNLVVFRNAFTYAFRRWQECDAEGFAAADKWLARQASHGRTDVFSTVASVLTLPRDPKRPLIALIVTDGDANEGVSDTAEILSRFTSLNGGLVSVYMYGVKENANRELIDMLTHGNRGESFIFDGWRWNAGARIEELSERFRDPVLSDLRIVFSTMTEAEQYPRMLKNIYRGGTLDFVGRVPLDSTKVSFSLRGLNGEKAFESFFTLFFDESASDQTIASRWKAEREIDVKINGN